jgi:hypothetical protein
MGEEPVSYSMLTYDQAGFRFGTGNTFHSLQPVEEQERRGADGYVSLAPSAPSARGMLITCLFVLCYDCHLKTEFLAVTNCDTGPSPCRDPLRVWVGSAVLQDTETLERPLGIADASSAIC